MLKLSLFMLLSLSFSSYAQLNKDTPNIITERCNRLLGKGAPWSEPTTFRQRYPTIVGSWIYPGDTQKFHKDFDESAYKLIKQMEDEITVICSSPNPGMQSTYGNAEERWQKECAKKFDANSRRRFQCEFVFKMYSKEMSSYLKGLEDGSRMKNEKCSASVSGDSINSGDRTFPAKDVVLPSNVGERGASAIEQ